MKVISNSRQAIMDRLRTRSVPGPALPDLDASQLTQYDDPVSKFCEMVALVGGQVHLVDGPEQGRETLQQFEPFRQAQRVASLVPEIVEATVDVAAVQDPHELESLDWVIASGEFCVAENGAIWVDGKTLPHRVLLFIPQYLAIVVSRGQIVHHMHQAYARIEKPVSRFGVFVAGPSKTADIEQSLVLGAHGCRALQVILLP